MGFIIECKKVKRTGFIPAFICAGIFSAAIPVINMAVRHKIYTSSAGSPVNILFNANWQVMAMLNMLAVVICACIIYNSEYAGNAMQKMHMLPVHEGYMFLGKFVLMFLMCIAILAIESAGIMFCTDHWFSSGSQALYLVLKSFAYEMVIMVPAALSALFIASAFKNMWITLGLCVVCIFMATMLPADNFILSLFPFAMPFQVFAGTAEKTIQGFIAASFIESIIIIIAEFLLIKIRRLFE